MSDLRTDRVLELIKIGNLLPPDAEPLNYEEEFKSRYFNKTSRPMINKGLDYEAFDNLKSDIWEEIRLLYPKVAEYVESDSRIDLDDPPKTELKPSALLINQTRLIPRWSAEEKNIPKAISAIRVLRIWNNIQWAAQAVRDWQYRNLSNKKGLAPVALRNANVRWQTEFYSPFGIDNDYPHILTKSVNNKEIGFLVFPKTRSLVEAILSDIDIFQIKTCGNCYKLFFADPRNMKYCSDVCNNRKKANRYNQKQKQK